MRVTGASNIVLPGRMRIPTSSSHGCWPACTTASPRGAKPPPPVIGNAYRAEGEPLPTHWATAIERFAASEFAREYLGKPFAQLYATVKQGELDDFDTYVTPLEIEWYMGAL